MYKCNVSAYDKFLWCDVTSLIDLLLFRSIAGTCDLLSNHGLGLLSFLMKWESVSLIFNISDSLLSDWSRFHNIISKENLQNFHQFHPNVIFVTKLAKSQNVLILWLSWFGISNKLPLKWYTIYFWSFFVRSKMFGKGDRSTPPRNFILENCVINSNTCVLRYSYSQTASVPLNWRSSLRLQISTNLPYPRSINHLISFCYSYSQRASFPLNWHSSLPVQIFTNLAYPSSISVSVSFCSWYLQRA